MATLDQFNSNPLLTTLESALSECRVQFKTMQVYVDTIASLRKENAQLKAELETARQDLAKSRHNHWDNVQAAQGDSPDFMKLIGKYESAMSQIRCLKRKLDRQNQRLPSMRSAISPAAPSPSSSSPTLGGMAVITGEAAGSFTGTHAMSSANPAKRRKVEERQPLAEVSPNKSSLNNVRRALAGSRGPSKAVAAIPALAEDGESCLRSSSTTIQSSGQEKNKADKNRLPGLLDDPTPDRTTLDKVDRISNSGHVASASPAPAGGLSSIKHSTKTHEVGQLVGIDVGTIPLVKATHRLPKTRLTTADPEDHEPFSVRPLHRLSMHHFKPNQTWLSKNGMSINDFLQGENGERVRALASTLPQQRTDDELLVEFLGAGSESRVASLTRLARENLLAEAKLKHVAMAFGIVRQDHDQRREMPGFWRTEFPSTQEEKDDRDRARLVEREEVSRRYEDARSAGGKWVFADDS